VHHGFTNMPDGMIRLTMNALHETRPWADTDSPLNLRWVATPDGLQMRWTASQPDTAERTLETVHEQPMTRAA
jgi:hypothetical protein